LVPGYFYSDACAHQNADCDRDADQHAHADRDAGYAERDGHSCDGHPHARHADRYCDTHSNGDKYAAHVNSHADRQRDDAAADRYLDIHSHSDR